MTPSQYWNKDLWAHWLGPKNLGKVLVDGISMVALIDNEAQMNSVTPSFARAQNLPVGPISELNELIQGQIVILGAEVMWW